MDEAAVDWDARYREAGYRYGTEPNPWLVAHASLLPGGGRALDLACGEGRDAVFLAHLGLSVTGVDGSRVALEKARRLAAMRGVEVTWEQLDLEGGWRPEENAFDVVTCCNFLHRPLLAALPAALRPGGLLLYTSFLEGQEVYGRPSNPDHLLRRGELLAACAGLEILDHEEGATSYRGRPAFRASVCARRGEEGTGGGDPQIDADFRRSSGGG